MSETTMGPGRKDDQRKLRVDLLPVGALAAVGAVMTFGAEKYGANNWQAVTPRRRYYGAALRHLFARARGQACDPETGLPHLAHAACCILFMLSAEVGHDDPEAFEDRKMEEVVEVVTPPAPAPTWTPRVGERVRVKPSDGHSWGGVIGEVLTCDGGDPFPIRILLEDDDYSDREVPFRIDELEPAA